MIEKLRFFLSFASLT